MFHFELDSSVTSRAPAWTLEAIFLFSLVFGPLAFGATEPWSLAILEISLFLLLFLCVFRGSLDLQGPVSTLLLPGMLALLGIGLIQRLQARPIVAPASVLPFTTNPRGTTSELLLWSAYVALVLSVPSILHRREARKRCAWTIFLLGAFVAFVGIAQRGQGNSAYYGLRAIRQGHPFGPYTNYDHAACMMTLSLFMGMGILFSRFESLRRASNLTRVSDLIATQSLIVVALLLIVCGIAETGSRGAAVSLTCSLLIIAGGATAFIEDRRRRWLGRAGLLAAAMVFGAVFFRYSDWVRRLLTSPDLSTTYRLSMFRQGMRLFGDFPVFGIGLGGVINAFPAYQERLVSGTVDHIHNDWLEILIETGVAGFLLFSTALGALALRLAKRWSNSEDASDRWMIGGGLAAATAFIFHGFVDFNLHIPANAVLFFTIVSFLGTDSVPIGACTSKARMGTSSALVFCFGAGWLALSLAAMRPAFAWFHYNRALEAPHKEESLALLSRAYDWDADPRFEYLSSAIELQTAEGERANRTLALRQALGHSERAVAGDPLNPNFLYLQGAVMWSLGRVDDAVGILKQSGWL